MAQEGICTPYGEPPPGSGASFALAAKGRKFLLLFLFFVFKRSPGNTQIAVKTTVLKRIANFSENHNTKIYEIMIIIIIMFNTSIALFTFTYDQKRFTNFKNPI